MRYLAHCRTTLEALRAAGRPRQRSPPCARSV